MPLSRNPGSKIGKTKTTSSPVIPSKQCRYCERKFSKVEHLKRHERSHTGERPYTCPRCNKSFSRSDVLIRHLKNHPRLPDQEIKNERPEKAEREVDPKTSQVQQEIAQNSASAAPSLASVSNTEYSSQLKQDESRKFSVQSNDPTTNVSQFTSGLDHLATLASRRNYGSGMMDPMLRAEPNRAYHEIPYHETNTDQPYDWNQDRSALQLSIQIDPNLDPRLTQPEKFLPSPDKEKTEVAEKCDSNQQKKL